VPAHPITSNVDDSHQRPRVALLAIRLDTAPGAHPDSLAQYELGKWVHIDQFVIVRQVLPQQTLDRDSAVNPVRF